MDFKPSPEVETLRERILDFMDENVYPQERQIMEGLDAEVADGAEEEVEGEVDQDAEPRGGVDHDDGEPEFAEAEDFEGIEDEKI